MQLIELAHSRFEIVDRALAEFDGDVVGNGQEWWKQRAAWEESRRYACAWLAEAHRIKGELHAIAGQKMHARQEGEAASILFARVPNILRKASPNVRWTEESIRKLEDIVQRMP